MSAAAIRREEMHAKIRMVMEAHGTPMTVKEIRQHPVMTGLTGQKIGNHLLHMPGVRMGKGKRWALNGTKTKVKVEPKKVAKVMAKPKKNKKKQILSEVINEWGTQNTHFRITKEGKLFLNINGISFPVEIE